MKNRKKVFHLPGSPMAKSLQRWKELWETNPESMELRRKRGVEKRRRNCNKYKDHLWNYFVSDDPGTEITPEYLNRICYHFVNEKRNQGSRWTKLKSFKRFLTKNGFIKYDFERDLYLNCHKIKRLEEIRVETDRRRAEEEAQRIRDEAQRAEDERLRLEQIETYKVRREAQHIEGEAQQAKKKREAVERWEAEKAEREAQQRHREAEPQQAEAKPPQAHRETQPQQGTQAEQSVVSDLRLLKLKRRNALNQVQFYKIQSEKETDQAKLEKCLHLLELYNEHLSRFDLEISKLENCGEKLSVEN